MENYLKFIKVDNIFHLQDFEIKIDQTSAPHLFITGKNGSGKTVLLNAIAEYLNYMNLHSKHRGIKMLRDKVSLKFAAGMFSSNIFDVYKDEDFIFAQYEAYRKPKMIEPTNPEKPEIYDKNVAINKELSSQFIRFIVDLKFQEALARNEGQIENADGIKKWFSEFEQLLGEIYNDSNLKIEFKYQDYSCRINTDGKLFRFTELSDGFAAIIDIISDLILKMQSQGSLNRVYDKKGIVLIDEVETHLHLELQKNIMPILTKVFPNIQFIVTTHSPFVLSSLPNAVAFDLEHKDIIEDLNQYSYEALAEGYFGVKTESSYMEMRLNELKILLEKDSWTIAERSKMQQLIDDFNNVAEVASPDIKGEYNRMMIAFADKIREVIND